MLLIKSVDGFQQIIYGGLHFLPSVYCWEGFFGGFFWFSHHWSCWLGNGWKTPTIFGLKSQIEKKVKITSLIFCRIFLLLKPHCRTNSDTQATGQISMGCRLWLSQPALRMTLKKHIMSSKLNDSPVGVPERPIFG